MIDPLNRFKLISVFVRGEGERRKTVTGKEITREVDLAHENTYLPSMKKLGPSATVLGRTSDGS